MNSKYLCFLVLIVSFPLNLFSQKEDAHNIHPLEIGSPLPEFSLIGVDDKQYNHASFKEYTLLVVIFTCNHCPTAQAYEKRIADLHSEYYNKGVGFVAISPNNNEALSLAECGYSDLDDSFEAMKLRAKDIDMQFPYLYDGETSNTSMKFGPVATPHVFIFDRDRRLRYRGRIDDMENPYDVPSSFDTRKAIEALLSGNSVEPETTKTFGCSVKWPWKDEWTKQLIKNWSEEEVLLESASKEKLAELLANEGENLRLINVWATYCGPCIMEYPDLVDTYRMYSGRGFDFVSICMDSPKSRGKALKYLTEQHSSVNNYIWTGGSSYDAIDIIDPDWQGSLPYTLLIKPGGDVIYKYEGPVDLLQLRKAIIGELGRYFADDN